MQKITLPEYRLPEIIPLQWVRTLAGGANQPLVIRGVDASGLPGEYVLKYRGAERMDEAACRRELLAAWIAAEMDIWTPEPVVIYIEEAFIDTVPPALQEALRRKSPGWNFGTRYLAANVSLQPSTELPPVLFQTAARIFAFDLMLQNADRRSEKPNAFLANERIYVYDHELAFGFLVMLPMFANPEPWILSQTDVAAAKNHLFYPMLCGNKAVDWEAALSSFSQLTPPFWQRANDLLPETWKDAQEMARIESHINQIGHHLHTFTEEIWNKLIG